MDKATMNAPVNQSKKTKQKFDRTFKQHAVELWLNSGKAARKWPRSWGFMPRG